MVVRIKLDADEAPREAGARHARGPGPGEGVEDDVAWLRECRDERLEDAHGLLGRVQPVAAVDPRLNVRQGRSRLGWIALGEKERLLVPGGEIAGSGGILLRPDEMPNGSQARLLPCVHERLNVLPAIEGDAQAVRLHDPESFPECRRDPGRVVIVRDHPPGAVAVPADIGGIGHHQIHAPLWERGKDGGAIAVVEGEKARHGCPMLRG